MMVTTSPVYELWDTETGNLIADYADEDAALRAVRAGINDEEPGAWEAIELVRVEPDGQRAPIAQGAALVGRALAPPSPDQEALQAAMVFIDTLSNPNFRRAIAELRIELMHMVQETAVSIESVRAATSYLSTVSGVPVRVDTEGSRVSLVTPSKTMAEFLAASAPPPPARDMPIRTVSEGYAVDIAA